MFDSGYILNPGAELLPDYKICPFSTPDIHINRSLPDSDFSDNYFGERFTGKSFHYTLNGRHAINIALSYYDLCPEDTVTILTTSGNHYISSCVTTEIERFCKWSRQIERNTRVLLVNHEFGYPFGGMAELRRTGIPIIEDCAHSFFSNDRESKIGTYGDFVIFSFSKMFPVQMGGLLICSINDFPGKDNADQLWKRYLKNVLSEYLQEKDEIIHKRITNYNYLLGKIKELGFDERFSLAEGIVPGVFMFKQEDRSINLDELKVFMYKNGIQCSVFYGEHSFYIPVHQKLTTNDLDYFVKVIERFIKDTL
jgi:hypothetical protein